MKNVPKGQIYVRGIFVEHSHDIFPEYSRNIRYNFPGIMNLGIFHEYPANVTCIFYVDQELQYQFFLIYKAVPDIHCVSLKILVFS